MGICLGIPVDDARRPGARVGAAPRTGGRHRIADRAAGLRIRQPDPQRPGDAFERRSDLSVDDVVSKLPQFTPDFGSTSNNPGNGGQSNVQLRGLGATSTLVLLDGRRIIPANGSGVVDVNLIPPSLIESVEVVTGGASAVYGSDAIAGVVNFKLRNKFEGVQFDVRSGVTGHRSDG